MNILLKVLMLKLVNCRDKQFSNVIEMGFDLSQTTVKRRIEDKLNTFQ